MRRRRLAVGVLLMFGALGANAYLAYLLILRNPAELEAKIRQALQWVAPEYDPEIGKLEFSLRERQAVITNLVFHERGGAGRPLVQVQRAEVTFGLLPPVVKSVILDTPSATIRIDREGNLNFPKPGGGDDEERATGFGADVDVSVRKGWVRVQNDFEDQGSDVLLSDIDVDLTLTRDLEVRARGGARLGALFDLKDVPGGRQGMGVPLDKRFHDVFPRVELAVHRQAAGPLQAEALLRGGALSPQLKSLIPVFFQRTIWTELDPSGGQVDVHLRVSHREEQGLRLDASVRPRGVTVEPKGFPIPITEVGGAFEVSVAVPPEEPPEILSVAWENVSGRVAGGEVLSRGAVWPGAAHERPTLFLFVDASEMGLTPEIVQAFPADIRAVYQRFDPQGTVGRAKVTIFKPPFLTEPQISVQVEKIGGSISAAYEDYPVRLHDVEGSFSLKEGANVEISARGRLDLGGRVEVEAMVMHGDLIHVEVHGRDVPLGGRVLDALSPAVRRYVAPFHPEGGHTDFTVTVDKPGPKALAQPHVELDLQGVTLAHDLFPFRLAASGRLEVDPVFPAGARPEDDVSPVRIDVRMDLGLDRPKGEVAQAKVTGNLTIPLGEEEPYGDLQVSAARVQLTPELLEALPPGLQEVRAQLRPEGALVELAGRVEALDRLAFSAGGDGLILRPGPELEGRVPGRREQQRRFVVGVDRVRVRRHERRVQLEALSGRPPGGGTLEARGEVVLGEGEGAEPILALDMEAKGAALDDRVLELLPPGGARDTLEKLDARGRVDARVRLRSGPGLPPQHAFLFTLRGVEAKVHTLDAALAGLAREPIREVRGEVRVELPRGAELIGLRGRLAGAEVELAGRIGTPPVAPRPEVAAALGGPGGAVLGLLGANLGPPMDLTVHVGGLDVDPERTGALGGPPAREALTRFPARGLLDLRAWLHRPAFAAAPRMRIRVEPRRMTVTPALLPVPCTEVEGMVELIDGKPVSIELAGKVGPGRFKVQRQRSLEAGYPGAGGLGMALGVELRGFERPEDPRPLEAELPARMRAALEAIDPQGPLDLLAQVYIPDDPSQAIHWVAEVHPHGLALTTGPRFTGIEGVVRASGRIAELDRGSAEGEIELAKLAWNEQTVSGLRGRFRLRDGVLSLGLRGAPFAGELYGGRLAGLVEYSFQTGAYEGWLEVRDPPSNMGRVVEELSKLQKKEPGEPQEASRPITGQLMATVRFVGGGQGLDGRPRRFEGAGEIHASKTNLVEVPGLDVFRGLADAVRGETSGTPLAFETMYVKYHVNPSRNGERWRLWLDEVRLDSPAIALEGGGGWVRFSSNPETNGDIRLDLVPFRGPGLLQWIAEQNLFPLTGYSIRGKVWDPGVVTPLPFIYTLDRAYRAVTGNPDEDEEEE